jgi:predicted metal-binding protein
MKNCEGAFSIYQPGEVELVGYTTCDGCPGGNVEYACDEMVKNGAEAVHLATGLVVGYPPCPYIETFVDFIQTKYDIDVVVGTHPIPEKYMGMHERLGTWKDPAWKPYLAPTLSDRETRLAFN